LKVSDTVSFNRFSSCFEIQSKLKITLLYRLWNSSFYRVQRSTKKNMGHLDILENLRYKKN